MGRNRLFDEADVVRRATRAFLVAGYEGTSVGELVTATGLHRGSLYQAFGSKRGLFLACLRHVVTDRSADVAMDLVLVALLELAPRDPEVCGLLGDHLDRRGVTAHDLGARLLARALIHPSED
ncbi:TetR/AcrR family transcriptional regulator [Nocardioides sp. Leaf285]|uniref:TetR/AcrR family transcriptional regulator n=1 Tax=Nocardioides sp. Leaf285 TaxID=1736322 RepID=UPI0007037BFD|nr:helix-turn-helix domain-containing protein [Nocardioides sp. Leaf285]KQP66897.1 hypothetical protein ASF47_04110 [Nocardioides sp. Leaf285]